MAENKVIVLTDLRADTKQTIKEIRTGDGATVYYETLRAGKVDQEETGWLVEIDNRYYFMNDTDKVYTDGSGEYACPYSVLRELNFDLDGAMYSAIKQGNTTQVFVARDTEEIVSREDGGTSNGDVSMLKMGFFYTYTIVDNKLTSIMGMIYDSKGEVSNVIAASIEYGTAVFTQNAPTTLDGYTYCS